MRLFASVGLDGLEPGIAAAQDPLTGVSGVRRTDPGRVHVTLKFLGEVEETRLDDLVAALETAVERSGVGPFRVEFGGLGAFPSEEYIRVVWVGVRAGGDELAALHDAIERETVALGLDPDDHDFTPHATVARMDHAGGKEAVRRAIAETDPTVGTREIEAVRLTESVLTDDGPEYATVERFEL